MSETSRFWDGTTTGDASSAPYDGATEFSQVMASLCGSRGIEVNQSGVFVEPDIGYLAPSSPAANTIRIGPGRAVNYGGWYQSDANVDTNIPTPAASTRIDRLVLSKDWTLQNIRVKRVAGVEGGSAPTLVLSAGSEWQMPLCQVSITTGGVMTITDQRQFLFVRRPEVYVRNTVSPNVATDYIVAYDGLIYRSMASLWSTGDNTKLTLPLPGLWEIGLGGTASTGTPTLVVYKNGVAAGQAVLISGSSSILSVLLRDVVPSDYIQIHFTFTGGGTQTLGNPQLFARYIGNS